MFSKNALWIKNRHLVMLKEDDAFKMIHEDRSVFWEVMVSVIVREEVYTTTYLILNGYKTELFESPDLTPLDFCL
jgi:hypothetical protein